MQEIYDEYGEKLLSYNELAEEFNDDLAALATDNTIVLPEIPCAPYKPSNAYSLPFKSNSSKIKISA